MTLFSVPTDRTAIVKDVRIWVPAGASASGTYLFTNHGDYQIWDAWTLAAASLHVVSPIWVVLEEEEDLQLFTEAGTAVEFQITISGTLLVGDPS